MSLSSFPFLCGTEFLNVFALTTWRVPVQDTLQAIGHPPMANCTTTSGSVSRVLLGEAAGPDKHPKGSVPKGSTLGCRRSDVS